MQREHRIAHAKNYALLVNKTPVDDILDELRHAHSTCSQRIKGKPIYIAPCLRVISSLSALKYTSPPR
jgi:hypothetical protein